MYRWTVESGGSCYAAVGGGRDRWEIKVQILVHFMETQKWINFWLPFSYLFIVLNDLLASFKYITEDWSLLMLKPSLQIGLCLYTVYF